VQRPFSTGGGALVVIASLGPMRTAERRLLATGAGAATLALGVGVASAALLGRGLSRPVAALSTAAERIAVFGTSAKYLSVLEKEGVQPRIQFDLSSLRAILSTGSPLAAHSYDFVYAQIKSNVRLASISGGTDIVSCFALGDPTGPVYRGELQLRGVTAIEGAWLHDAAPSEWDTLPMAADWFVLADAVHAPGAMKLYRHMRLLGVEVGCEIAGRIVAGVRIGHVAGQHTLETG
jgi:hypothetical protein